MSDATILADSTAEFSKAFEELAKMEGGNAAPAAPAEAAAPEPVEAPAEETPVGDGEAPAAPEPAGDSAAEEPDQTAGDAGDDEEDEKPAAAPEPEATREDVMKRFADLLERQERAKQEQAQQPQQEQPAPPLFNEEEYKVLTEFEKDYPDVAPAVRIITAKNQQLLAQHIFKTVDDFLKPRLELLDAVAYRAHVTDIKQAVPQYSDEYADKVAAWALSDQQPRYLREAFKQVIDHGEAEEIQDLFSRYEAAHGAPAQKPSSRKPAELPSTAKQAARAMAPVSGKRSAPSVQVEPESYETAFEKFAREMKL